jgi:hypothetical protein
MTTEITTGYRTIRADFPQVYSTPEGAYMVSARRKKLGMNERKTFATQKEALDYRKQILENLTKYGAQPTIPTETKHQAELYGALLERLKAFGKRPEEAVDHSPDKNDKSETAYKKSGEIYYKLTRLVRSLYPKSWSEFEPMFSGRKCAPDIPLKMDWRKSWNIKNGLRIRRLQVQVLPDAPFTLRRLFGLWSFLCHFVLPIRA